MATPIEIINNASIDFSDKKTIKANDYDDIYFSTDDGVAETNHVFIEANQLWDRWRAHQYLSFIIAESGFGSGLNFLITTSLFQKFITQFPNSKLKRLFFISFEKNPFSKQQFAQAHSCYPQFLFLSNQLQSIWPVATINGCQRLHFGAVTLDIWLGDINNNIHLLSDEMNNSIDAWFFDGFTPRKNPDMWQQSLFNRIYQLTHTSGTFATFTAASIVRERLIKSGFTVNKRVGFGKKREMLCGHIANIEEHKNKNQPLSPWYLTPSSFPIKQDSLLNHQCTDDELNDDNVDVAIIGGGIASLFCASSLLARGAKVTLYCNDEELAQNASSNLQGAFYPQLSDDDLRNSQFYAHAFNYGYQKYQQFVTALPTIIDFSGVALCNYDARSSKKINKITSQNWPSSLIKAIDSDDLYHYSGVKSPYQGAFFPHGGWLTPRPLILQYFEQLKTKGLNIITHTSVDKIEKITAKEREDKSLSNQHWKLLSKDTCYLHEVVIIANGHKINQFEQTSQLPVYPVRGQVTHIKSGDQLKNLKCVLCFDGYLTPAHPLQHTHCIGASHVRNSIDRSFNTQEQMDNILRIKRNLPNTSLTKEISLDDASANTGIRCSTRERVPMVGAVADIHSLVIDYRNLFNLRRRKEFIPNAACHENLYIIGALGSRGLTSAPLLAEILVSQI